MTSPIAKNLRKKTSISRPTKGASGSGERPREHRRHVTREGTAGTALVPMSLLAIAQAKLIAITEASVTPEQSLKSNDSGSGRPPRRCSHVLHAVVPASSPRRASPGPNVATSPDSVVPVAACNHYRLDVSGAQFGDCTCGRPKREHTWPPPPPPRPAAQKFEEMTQAKINLKRKVQPFQAFERYGFRPRGLTAFILHKACVRGSRQVLACRIRSQSKSKFKVRLWSST